MSHGVSGVEIRQIALNGRVFQLGIELSDERIILRTMWFLTPNMILIKTRKSIYSIDSKAYSIDSSAKQLSKKGIGPCQPTLGRVL